MRIERLHALRHHDLPSALREAEALWNDATTAGATQVAATAAAHAAFYLHLIDGEAAAHAWRERAAAGAEGAGPEVLADWCLARAGQMCLIDEHAEELRLALRAQELTEHQSGSAHPVRAALATMHTVPLRGELRVRRHLGDLQAAGEAMLHDVFDVQFRFALLSGAQMGLELARCEPQLAAIEALAVAQGNRWLHASVAGLRADMAAATGDHELRRKWQEQSRERQLAYGNRMLACRDADILAELAVRRGELDEATRRIDELQCAIGGRGWRHIERNLLVTRYGLAEARGDTENMRRFAEAVEAMEIEAAVKLREVAAIREQLARIEVERAEFEQQLQAERLRFAERSNDTWKYGALLGGSLLVALLAVSWYARRRLHRANLELAAEFERAETARRDRQALEDRVRYIERAEGLGTLAAGVAHDFNNLLTGILGSAELLRGERAEAGRQELVDSILASGQQGARLCRQLQVYDAEAPVSMQPHDLRQLVNESAAALLAGGPPNVKIELQLGDEPVPVDVDRARFEQVLLNLVQNARESGAKQISISLGRGRLAPDGDDDGTSAAAVVEVHDNGSGMAPEVAARVFDPYFSTKFPGRGLGLAVAFGCVRRHGGTIEVESRVGHGTAFRVRLPLRERPVAIPAVPPRVIERSPETALPAATLLVVDDEPHVRAVLTAMLNRLGLQGQAASGGGEALAMVVAAQPALPLLMFVDLSMPELDGAEVCERVRALRPDARIVLMSGHVTEHFEDVVRRVRPNATLGKPFRLEEVRQVLRTLADGVVAVS